MEDRLHSKWKTIRSETEDASDSPLPLSEEFYGYVPNYPPPLEINPFNLIEGNENKSY